MHKDVTVPTLTGKKNHKNLANARRGSRLSSASLYIYGLVIAVCANLRALPITTIIHMDILLISTSGKTTVLGGRESRH